MITPCCKKKISMDDIWNAIESNDAGVTNKSIECPECGRRLTVFLDIDSVELEE